MGHRRRSAARKPRDAWPEAPDDGRGGEVVFVSHCLLTLARECRRLDVDVPLLEHSLPAVPGTGAAAPGPRRRPPTAPGSR